MDQNAIDIEINEIIKQSQQNNSDVIEKLEEKANYYKNQSNHKSALECFKKCHEIAKQKQNNAIQIAEILQNIGYEQYQIGEFEEALTNCKNSLNIKNIELNPNDESIIKTQYLLGSIYFSQGKFEEALNASNSIMGIYKKTLPADDILIGHANSNLAIVYQKQGDFEKAIEYYTNALNITRTLNSKDPSLAGIYNNLASSYNKLGKYKEATEYHTLSSAIKAESFEALKPKDNGI